MNACGKKLVILTGLTHTESRNLVTKLDKAGLIEKFNFLPIPFGPNQHQYTKKYIQNMLIEAAKKTQRINTNKNSNEYASPGNILLVYSEDIENYDLIKKLYRPFELCSYTKKDHTEELTKHLVSIFQKREILNMNFLARNDSSLLPFRNFFIEKNITIDHKILNNESVSFTKATFPKYKIQGQTKSVLRDAREICFELAHESHGNIALNAYTPEDAFNFLDATYRFGCPIQPGHHYHVSKDGGDLEGTSFFCSRLNTKIVCEKNQTYLNMTPNDAIRS